MPLGESEKVKKVKILALITAILTALLLFMFLNSLGGSPDTIRSDVLVAVRDIPAGTVITENMIAQSKIPGEAIASGAIADTSSVVGKVAGATIYAGEQILVAKLVAAGDANASSLSYALKPGMRAVTIAVDGVSGLAYMLKPGNHVDIIAQYNLKNANQSKAELIVQDVTVLAVDATMSAQGKAGGADLAYSTITLQTTPAEALKISFYQYTGKLNVMLRSPVDEQKNNLPAITMN